MTTLFSGISPGTEMLAYRGEVDPSLPLDETIGALGDTFEYPFEYGYSAVGFVQGGKVVPEDVPVFSFQPHGSHFTARPDEVFALPDVEPRLGTLFPLVETALQIRLDAGDVGDRTVVVVGLGSVGILAAALLQRAGARVVGVDPLGWKRTAAEGFGVEGAAPDEVRETLSRITDGQGASLLVEVSGNPAALADSLSLLAHEGTALVASWYGTKPVALPLGAEFHRRRLTIASSQVSTIPTRLKGEWTMERRREETIGLMRELPLALLATHTFPVSRAPEAYEAIDRGTEGLIHVALSYD